MGNYIVVSNSGDYAKELLEQFPNYRGIDRFPWHLSKEDIAGICKLGKEKQAEAEKCLAKLMDMCIVDLCSEDFSYAYNYFRLSHILEIHADLLSCVIYDDKSAVVKEERTDTSRFEFLGYDYILSEAAYSCIIWEKRFVDQIENIPLNQNGLFNTFDEAKRFIDLREVAKKKYDGNGFEFGGPESYWIVAVYRYI